MYANDKIYNTMNEAVEHELLPLLEGWEKDFDLEFLAYALITEHCDENGYLTGFGAAQVTDEELGAILDEAIAMAEEW